MECDIEECILRLERISSSAKLLKTSLKNHDWYDNVKKEILQISNDVEKVADSILNDKNWESGDR